MTFYGELLNDRVRENALPAKGPRLNLCFLYIGLVDFLPKTAELCYQSLLDSTEVEEPITKADSAFCCMPLVIPDFVCSH